MIMSLQMVQGSNVGTDYYGYVNEADIYLDGPLGLSRWVEIGSSGPIPFHITAS